MKTICVDDEVLGLERIKADCAELADVDMIGMFEDPTEALAFAKKNRVDLAFLDIMMPKMNGMDLSDRLHELYPDMIVIFVSAYDDYMPDAFRKRGADYFLVKPFDPVDVEAVVKRAKLLSKRFIKHIYIETFGRFNIYLDNKPINFTSDTAKELLALMVDRRGTALGNQEAFDYMWMNKNYDNASAVALHKGLRRLKDTLEKNGIGNLVIRVSPSEHKLNTDIVDCDYYQFLEGDPQACRKFNGRYMANWSWGEETTAELMEMLNRNS